MRRFGLGLIAALVVLAVGCSGGGDSKKFPDEVRKNFLETCTTSGANQKQCNCTLEKLEEKYNVEQFRELERRIAAGDASAEAEIAPFVSACRNA